MSTHPIVFSGEMVKAILAGRKTQTRRVVTPRNSTLGAYPNRWADCHFGEAWADRGYGDWQYLHVPLLTMHVMDVVDRCRSRIHPGDVMWVKEATTYIEAETGEDFLCYVADNKCVSISEWQHPHPIYDHCVGRFGKTVPSISMPRWACRLFLRVVAVRVERVQDITEADAQAEGVIEGCGNRVEGCALDYCRADMPEGCPYLTHRNGFHELWDSINAKRGYGWDTNPWTWVYEFERIDKPEDWEPR